MPTSSSRPSSPSRRSFLQMGALALSGVALGTLGAQPAPVVAAPKDRRLLKTLKIGMVQVPGSLSDKFKAVREIGFDGIELNSPGVGIEETTQAIAASGLPVDGTVCSTHWKIRHTSADPAVRAQALQDLKEAIRQTHAVGGHSVLLVPGHGQDGDEAEIWDRSIENIRQALPLAAELGVFIAIENVWNHFLYDHDGPADQSAEKLRDYVDAFRSPWMGVQFDIGNHQKYGDPAEWIRTLDKRIVKLDVKDWNAESGWVSIGQGEVNWADVRKALAEIRYTGWAAAEVKGGDREQLQTINQQMNEVFAL